MAAKSAAISLSPTPLSRVNWPNLRNFDKNNEQMNCTSGIFAVTKTCTRVRHQTAGCLICTSTVTTKVKESAVLTEGSLAVLAREIGGEKVNGLVLCMYLNIPTTTIVNAANSASEYGLRNANDTAKIETTQKLLLTWKSLRVGSKEKDKVKDLERALREMGKPDMADVINDKHANHTELTSDAFAS